MFPPNQQQQAFMPQQNPAAAPMSSALLGIPMQPQTPAPPAIHALLWQKIQQYLAQQRAQQISQQAQQMMSGAGQQQQQGQPQQASMPQQAPMPGM